MNLSCFIKMFAKFLWHARLACSRSYHKNSNFQTSSSLPIFNGPGRLFQIDIILYWRIEKRHLFDDFSLTLMPLMPVIHIFSKVTQCVRKFQCGFDYKLVKTFLKPNWLCVEKLTHLEFFVTKNTLLFFKGNSLDLSTRS